MDYNATVDMVMNLLKEKGVCSSSQKSHKDCYFSFAQFLEQTKQEYSGKARDSWLTWMKDKFPRQRCMVWNPYIYQLEEMDAIGTVSDRRLYLNRSNYDKLPFTWKKDLDSYLDDCRSRYTARTWELTRIYCSEALLFLFDIGVIEARKITYKVITEFLEMDMYCSSENKTVILSYTARMLRFFSKKRLCPDGFALLLDSQIYPHVGRLEDFSTSNINKVLQTQEKSSEFPADEFRETIEPFIETLTKHGYVGTTLYLARHSLMALYLFLDIYALGYHPDIMWSWFFEISKDMGHSRFHWRRILKCYEEYASLGDILPDGKYSYAPSSLESLPSWCRQAIEVFLAQKKREFRENVSKYQYPCIRFCRFLISCGYESFEQLSPTIVKEFSRQDKHDTFRGKSSYYTIVRGLLRFLGEKGYTAYETLHNCLFAGTAPQERIVDILTEGQLRRISEFRLSHHGPIELRDTAIVMLGIKMGLRASDVLNLRFRDIDWKKREVTIVMKKTRTQITLPMPVDVGNAIFSYIRTGRPSSDDTHIFIRSKAPFGKLTGKVCTKALYRILPERCDMKGGGFHVTRRTFATNLLRNRVGIDDVMDALGHRDPTSVMKYLFLDEERSRSCALSLAEAGISVKGGLA
jgi:integrase